MRVIAVGLASVELNAGWVDEHTFRYEVWSDPDGILVDWYDARSEFDDTPNRHAYILDNTGTAVVYHQGAVSVGADPHAVLADCEALFGEGAGEGGGE